MEPNNNFALNDLIITLRTVEESLESLHREVQQVRSQYERPIIIRELIQKVKSDNITYLNPSGVRAIYPISHEEADIILKELRDRGLVKTHEDDLYDEVKIWIKTQAKISTSYLQRRFKIGYAAAARVMDQLEENGIIGPQDGTKPRKIL